ncbi:sulfur carrier protein ThiS [Nocardioides sp. 616]|uniref:sulfur carrier protein ThiS n=1 Tax=Nocardioides sp. 616 TaxID=2268090 RepID=UPI000CE558CA|nr:sulfur carrier protein ThiS [Nocardioides sp. 616]
MRIVLNGSPAEVPPGTVAELLGGLRPGVAVAVNGEVVPRAAVGCRELVPGDVVEVVTAVQGG